MPRVLLIKVGNGVYIKVGNDIQLFTAAHVDVVNAYIRELEEQLARKRDEVRRLRRRLGGERGVLVCHRWVASRKPEQMRRVLNEIEREERSQRFYDSVLRWVRDQPPGAEFHQMQVLRELGLSAVTFGDKLRAVLDYLCCRGVLEKVRFVQGAPGHRYRKVEDGEPCRYLSGGRRLCTFDFGAEGVYVRGSRDERSGENC
ncbi:MAG: hypothetical protein ACXQT6_05030 [Candidatus Methanospirareceae archaeon]